MADKKNNKSHPKTKSKKPAKNKKCGDAIKERAILLYATNGNISATAREIGVSKSTIFRWINAPEQSERVEQVRTEKRIEFADKASDIINTGLELLDRRMTTALEQENELERLILEISQIPEGEMPEKTKTALIKKIKKLELQSLSEITTAVGTLFDKRALARGEKTADVGVTIEALINSVQGDEY